MLTPIVCFSCGLPLGDLAFIYQYILAKRMTALYGTEDSPVAPASAPLDQGQRDNLMADVLDALRLTSCCRTRLCTAMDFRAYY